MSVTVSSFLHYLRLMVKIFQFLRLSTKFLAVLRLSLNPTETLFIPFTLFACCFPAVSVNISLKSCPPMNHVLFWKPPSNVEKHILLDKKYSKKQTELNELRQNNCLLFISFFAIIYLFILFYTIFFTLDFFK